MGSGERSSVKGFHLPRPVHHQGGHGRKQEVRSSVRDNHHHHHHHQVPKGCLAIKVGQLGEEQERFVVPVMYFNHPLFMQLLKEAEEEYGFDQKGTITIPCHVQEFRNIRGIIDRERSTFHHHHHHLGCFGF